MNFINGFLKIIDSEFLGIVIAFLLLYALFVVVSKYINRNKKVTKIPKEIGVEEFFKHGKVVHLSDGNSIANKFNAEQHSNDKQYGSDMEAFNKNKEVE